MKIRKRGACKFYCWCEEEKKRERGRERGRLARDGSMTLNEPSGIEKRSVRFDRYEKEREREREVVIV